MNKLISVKEGSAQASYDPAALGNTIRLLREQLQLTQAEVGSFSGLSTGEISKLEKGERKKIPLESLIKLSPCLNVSLDYLLSACLSFHQSDRERFYDYDGNEIDLYKISKNLYSADSSLLVLLSSPDFLSDAETINFVKSYIRIAACINQSHSSSDIIKRMFHDFKNYCDNFMDSVMILLESNDQQQNNAATITAEK